MGDIRGVLTHHTGGGGPNDWIVVRDGRPDLAGPLAQLTLELNGSFRVIAAGVCWHAGSADNQAIADRVRCSTDNGNHHLVGIEGVGGFECVYAGIGVSFPLGAQRLLALLALHDGGMHRAAAGERLWPDSPRSRAAANLRSALWRGRQVGDMILIKHVAHGFVWHLP